MRLSGQLRVSAASPTRPTRFMAGFVGTRPFLHRVKLFAAQNRIRFFGCPAHVLVSTATKTQSK
jgi:hypothetical protein